MTPKEKAQELVDKFYQLFPLQKDVIQIYGTLSWEYDNWEQAKQCALIAVEEIKEAIFWHPFESPNFELEYWQEVKQEIENL
jgi:pyruvate/oxaloacetate carboxyltransferase